MKITNPNPLFDHELEQRCHEFGKRVRRFCRRLKMDVANIEDVRQLVRASGSVGANYIEANENVGPGDLRFRMKVSRKEANVNQVERGGQMRTAWNLPACR